MKQYTNRTHSSSKQTPIEASLKKKEGYVYEMLLDKRNKIKPKFRVNDLVRVADLRKTFPKGDSTNWFFYLYKFAEVIIETIPRYRIDNLPERYNEALLEKTELAVKENKDVMKSLIIN